MVWNPNTYVQVVNFTNNHVGRDISMAIAGRVSQDTAENRVERLSISVSDQVFEAIVVPVKQDIQPPPPWLV